MIFVKMARERRRRSLPGCSIGRGWFYFKNTDSEDCYVGGGSLVLLLQTGFLKLPATWQAIGLDPAFYGILLSAVLFLSVSLVGPGNSQQAESLGTD